MRALLLILLLLAPIDASAQALLRLQVGAGAGASRPIQQFSITATREFQGVGTFDGASWVYDKLPDSAAIDANSATVVTTLRNGLLAAATTIYWYADYPIYEVPPNTPTVKVIVGTVNPDGTISRAANQVDLQPFFNAVPMPWPPTFATQQGTDHEAVIYRPSTHEMWEAWLWTLTGRMTTDSIGRQVPEWAISWGGYQQDVRTSSGWWATLQPSGANMGAVAAGLPIMSFAITVGDIRRQSVNHAVGLIIPVATNGNTWKSPAQRTDGPQVGTQYPIEGNRFRFPANINFNLYPATTWDGVSPKPLWRLFAEATRDYGMVIYDQGANAIAIGESGVTPQYLTDPFADSVNYPLVFGATGGLDYSYHAITDYPWDQLQLLQ